MSIVAVHGPNTMFSGGIAINGPASGRAASTNGMAWTFDAASSPRPAGDFDWTYTPAGGSPASPIADNKGPFTITFTTPGVKTVTLTVSGGSPGVPANGTYVLGVRAVAGPA
jgi:hypothetical protein